MDWVQRGENPLELFFAVARDPVSAKESLVGRSRDVVLLRHFRAVRAFRFEFEGGLT